MLLYLITLPCVLQLTVSTPAVQRNKLISYSLADKREFKKALGYNEDIYFNFTELVNKYGYPYEQHIITTEDNYILTVFRLLPKCDQVRKFPILLVHGIIDTSDTWIVTGPKDGLAYVLSSNCYDVWAANLRGNTYSRKHKYWDPNRDPEYWEYSFEENGIYDLPAIIDYIINITQRSKVHYIGHSQGTTDFFAMGSLRPEYNTKVQLSIHLAPITWLKNFRNPLVKIVSESVKDIKTILDNVGFAELFSKRQFVHNIVEFLCQLSPLSTCSIALTLTSGYATGNISTKNLAVIFGHILAGVSAKTLAHFGQLIKSGKFIRYDEGRKENIKKYGFPEPPEYNVSLVTSPVVLISAQNDWLSTLEDTKLLAAKLPNLIEEYVVPDSTWSHNDHIWGVNASNYVYNKILGHLKTFDTN